MWLASKFYNKCALFNISVSMSQHQLIWCNITLVSLLKMSKYRLHSSFFLYPVKKIENSNKFLSFMQAAGQICFLTPRWVVKWSHPWGTWNVVLWVPSDWSPVFTKRLKDRVPIERQGANEGKTWTTSLLRKRFCLHCASVPIIMLGKWQTPNTCWQVDAEWILASFSGTYRSWFRCWEDTL